MPGSLLFKHEYVRDAKGKFATTGGQKINNRGHKAYKGVNHGTKHDTAKIAQVRAAHPTYTAQDHHDAALYHAKKGNAAISEVHTAIAGHMAQSATAHAAVATPAPKVTKPKAPKAPKAPKKAKPVAETAKPEDANGKPSGKTVSGKLTFPAGHAVYADMPHKPQAAAAYVKAEFPQYTADDHFDAANKHDLAGHSLHAAAHAMAGDKIQSQHSAAATMQSASAHTNPIGHTDSGKPVHSDTHPNYSGMPKTNTEEAAGFVVGTHPSFTWKDHYDAAKLHASAGSIPQSAAHNVAAKKLAASNTVSGKPIFPADHEIYQNMSGHTANAASYVKVKFEDHNYTADDHWDAANKHEAAGYTLHAAAHKLAGDKLAGKKVPTVSAGDAAIAATHAAARSGDLHTKMTAPVTDAELGSLKHYQGSGYKEMNGHLRHGTPVDPATKQRITNIETAIAKSPLPEDTLLYRGHKGTHFQTNVKVGDTITQHGFLSTSISKSLAEQWAGPQGSVLHIAPSKKGHTGLSMNQHIPVSGVSIEKEVLLPHGTQFRVTKIEHDPKANRHVVHLERL